MLARNAVIENAPAAAEAARGSRPLNEDGCRAVLRDVGWGVLSTVEGTAPGELRPYGVPVGYAFDDESLYVATRPGRKLRAIEHRPTFCLTVLDVERFDRWRSVVVTGRPAWLDGAADRALAIRAFAGQRRPGAMRLTRRDTERLLAARILRVELEEISGRICGVWPQMQRLGAAPPAIDDSADAVSQLGDLDAAETDEATRVLDDVRRLVRALHGATGESRRELGVSAAQLFVLRQVAAEPGQSMRDLASRTRTTQSSVSEVVARLAARGLVERRPAPDDRRRAELTLTPAGRTLLRRAPDTVQERLIAGLGRLPDEQRRALADGFSAWLLESGLSQIVPAMFFEPAAGESAAGESAAGEPGAGEDAG